MKKLAFTVTTLLIFGIFISSCTKSVDDIPGKDIHEQNLNFKDVPAIHQAVYNYMVGNGLGQCSYFIHEDLSLLKSGATFIPSGPQGFVLTTGEFPLFTAFGGFSAMGGPDDWIRINPDGSATLQINSNEANAQYTDQVAFKQYLGAGRMHMHHTGTLVQIPLPGGMFLYMVDPGGRGAVVWHGKGDVLELGTTAPEYEFTAAYRVAGNGKVVRNVLKLK